ncbi:type VI secretion system Vgr family protein [Falsiroseomonas sp. CW058]|uniref:type VI secretion system Vgr family protein n=1 Tax=Falsiroseomonas sp. CW058 TaxID=3388664 RepID=UPI003D31AB67
MIGIRTPLGDDALTAVKLSVVEELGVPYTIEVEALGKSPNVQAKDLLGKDVTVTVTQRGPSPLVRHFGGVVAEFQRVGAGAAGRMTYRLVAVPRLALLALRRNCRVFQDLTVTDIVTKVLEDNGLQAPEFNVSGAGAPLPYCTQFNETDLHFVSRLLEEAGLTYHFEHAAAGPKMKVAGGPGDFPYADLAEMMAEHGATQLDMLSGWRRVNRVRSRRTLLHDMDEERSQPSVTLESNANTRNFAEEPAMDGFGEVFHWPGGMSTQGHAGTAVIEMSAAESASEEFQAQARDPRLRPGVRFHVAVKNEDASVTKRQYHVTAVRHEAFDHSGLVAGAGGTESYGATLRLAMNGRTWALPQRHPRPVMPGLQSATVTGPAGEKIHVDKFGRIKVKFRWDRFGKDDDTSSIWVRVMQPAAGAWGGAWFLPRVGDEVLVAFLEGDPDRPLVVGSVYGKDAPPPFDPGANKTQTGYRTRSYKSDSKADANILRFEDKKGSEEVLVHAQKDLTVEVENDETRNVGHDQVETIKNSRTTTIKDADDTYTLEKGSRTETIKIGDETLSIDMGNRATKLKMGNDDLKLGMGNFGLKCDLGAVTIEAMQSITLKVGGNSVVIDQTGVTIKGIMVKAEGQAMIETKAPLAQHSGDGMVIIKGGLVMIN